VKVLLISQGSTGDIYPLIALGRALLDAGHTVSFATAPLYRAEIEGAGLAFLHTPPDWEKPVFVECMRELDRQSNPILLLRQIYRSGLSFMGELIDRVEAYVQTHDLVVCSYVFPHFKLLCDRHNVPFATITFCHSVIPAKDITPELFPSLRGLPQPIQNQWNQLCWWLVNFAVDHAVNSISRATFISRGLPPVKDFIRAPAELSIVSVSKQLMGLSQHMDPRFQFTGYLRWQSKESEVLQHELELFCEGEAVPVLTFGSVSFDHVQDIMSRFAHRWPKGKKIIIQSGWAGLSVELSRPEIKIIHSVSHDQLFKFASCVIHHGGAGTTASVLHAGVPHVVVPHFGDQDFWASEVKRLGVGVSLPQKKWPELLPKAVARVTQKKKYSLRAKALAEILAKEPGAANAVQALADYVQQCAPMVGRELGSSI